MTGKKQTQTNIKKRQRYNQKYPRFNKRGGKRYNKKLKRFI